MPLDLLCFDADDTLWHNMHHFDAAETAFLAMMAPFADKQTARERLEAVSSANLRLYGYGVKSFTLSMIETAAALCGDHLTSEVIVALLGAGCDLLDHPVDLLDDVGDTLEKLAKASRLVLVTKGDLLHQETKLAASGLGELFAGVEIVSDKRVDTFIRIFERYGTEPAAAGMVGDSIRSDIVPALTAGAWAAFIPPASTWFHERAEPPRDHPRFTKLGRFADLPDWLDAVERRRER